MAENNDLPPTEADLLATQYINHQHPSIISLAKEIIKESESNTSTEHAILIHNYVRDSILFGWSGRFWNETASEILNTGRGYCNTKSSLFAALLRAVNIPCRLQFVDINSQILDGLLDPRTTYVEHTYTDVFNTEHKRWCHVDSYIVDVALASAAKEKLVQENKVIGYGVHRDGQSDWNGVDNTFIQYVTDSELNNKLERPLSRNVYGHFNDIGAFYAAADQHGVQDILNNRLLKWIFPLIVIPGNRAAQQLRKHYVN
jgi:transglutaminase-like putative cysteine protease